MRRLAASFTRNGAWLNAGLAVWTLLVFAFLFAPIVTAVLYSFNEGVLGRQSASLTGLTARWYGEAWGNDALQRSVIVSVEVAGVTAIVAALLGTLSGLVLARYPGRGARGSVEILVYLVLLVPEIVLAVASLIFYTRTGLPLGKWSLVAAHSTFAIGVVAIIVRARVLAIGNLTEEAAADLGAGRWRTLLDITLPQLRPAVLAGAILAFTFSFDDVVLSVFLTTPTVTTLPVYLFSSLRSGLSPSVYAVASVMLIFTLTTLALFLLIFRWQARRLGDRASVAAPLTGQGEPSAPPAGRAV